MALRAAKVDENQKTVTEPPQTERHLEIETLGSSDSHHGVRSLSLQPCIIANAPVNVQFGGKPARRHELHFQTVIASIPRVLRWREAQHIAISRIRNDLLGEIR